MATVTFACPDCHTNLKTSRRIAPDRDVRCPTCGTVFPAPPETDSDLLEFEDDGIDMTADGAGHEFEPTAGSRSAKLSSRIGRRTWSLILGSAVIVILFTAATAYFAWSAVVNRGRNSGTGLEDPLAYVPSDSSLIVGVNLGELAEHSDWRQQIEKGIRNLNVSPGFLDDCKGNTGIEFSELFDHVILAYKFDGLNPSEPPHTTLIAHSKIPFNQNKIRDSESEMYPEIVEGKFYYKRNVSEIQDLNFLFMPSDRIMVLSNLPQYDFEPLVEKDGTELFLSTEMATRIRGLQNDPLWAVLPFNEPLQWTLHWSSRAALKRTPEFAEVLEGLSHARAASTKGRWDEGKLALTVDLVCADEAAASKALTELQSFWEKHAKGWAELLPSLRKDHEGFVQEILTQAKFSRDGATVRLSTRFTPPPAETLAKLVPRQPWIIRAPDPRALPPDRMPPGRGGPGAPKQRPPIKVNLSVISDQ